MLGITAVEIFKKCTGLHGDKGKYVTKVEKKNTKNLPKKVTVENYAKCPVGYCCAFLLYSSLKDSLARELRYCAEYPIYVLQVWME